MRKFLAIVALAVISFGTANAQNPIPAGTKFLNVGLGFSNHGVPIGVGMDFGIGHDFSLGFDVTHRFNVEDYHANWGAAFNANYHFNRILNIPSSFDFYAGANIGAKFGHDDSGLDLGLQVGGRYFFTNKFGINLQFGGGNNFSGGKVGVTFKL